MQSLRLEVTIPENLELAVKLPEDIPTEPAELMVQVSAPAEESVSEPSSSRGIAQSVVCLIDRVRCVYWTCVPTLR
jgi:hypothetical protein